MFSSWTHFFLAILLLVSLLFLNSLRLLDDPLDFGRIVLGKLTRPLVALFAQLKAFLELFKNLRELAIQNEILEKQVAELSSQLASLEKAQEENKLLRQALGFQAIGPLRLLPAEIIGWDAFGSSGFYFDQGSKNGVEAGDAVIVGESLLAGRVTEVLERTSKMELITSAGFTVNAEVVPSGTRGVVKGEHGVGVLIDLVSQDAVIRPGQRIVTSGLGGKFPKNLAIGEIGKIVSQDTDLFQRAMVIPLANFRNLKYVFIVQE